jgi:hypothetical protein
MSGYPGHHDSLSEADAKVVSTAVGTTGPAMRREKIPSWQSARNAGSDKTASFTNVNNFVGLACIRCSPCIQDFSPPREYCCLFKAGFCRLNSVLRQLVAEHQGNRIVFYMTTEMSQSAPV